MPQAFGQGNQRRASPVRETLEGDVLFKAVDDSELSSCGIGDGDLPAVADPSLGTCDGGGEGEGEGEG